MSSIELKPLKIAADLRTTAPTAVLRWTEVVTVEVFAEWTAGVHGQHH